MEISCTFYFAWRPSWNQFDGFQHNKIYREKNFQIFQPLAIRKYFFLIWFCTLLNPELECVSLFTKWREVGGSFFIWKFEADLHNKVMIYSKERAFGAFWKLISKYLPFIDQFLAQMLWKFWTLIPLFRKLT